MNELDRLAIRYNVRSRRTQDPVSLIYRYVRAADREVAGFVVSVLTYGRVEIIMRNAGKVLDSLGEAPVKTLRNPGIRFEKIFKGFRHRLNKGPDIALLLYGLSEILKKHGSLLGLFQVSYSRSGEDLKKALGFFIRDIRNAVRMQSLKRHIPLGRVMHLLPSPEGNSACKRMNLFLKWMLRKDEIDPGVWAGRLPGLKSRLIIPLDVHVGRNARIRKMTRRKSDDWKTAEEVTAFLKRLCPEDPLKYDFAICHEGMDAVRFREHA